MSYSAGIAEAFTRLTDNLGRLVTQHLTLARTEIESEAQALSTRALGFGRAVGIAAPFAIAGIAVFSLGVANGLALLMEPWLGRGSQLVSLLVVGGVETLVAVRWLLTQIQLTEARYANRKTDARLPEPAPVIETNVIHGERPLRPEEHAYGSVGRT